jgi:hypothetical protein
MLAILSLLGGGLMRLLPEFIALWNKRTDNVHELAMLDRQFELEKQRSAEERAKAEIYAASAREVGYLETQKVALETQMQKTGITLVDTLNFLVRPIVTYYLLVMYGLFKLGNFIVTVQQGTGAWTAVLQVYTPEDFNLLSSVIAFWFVGRVFDKSAK